MLEKSNKKKIHWVEMLGFLVVVCIVLFYDLYIIRFHPDESMRVFASRYFEYLFKFDLSLWKENYWTLTQPPLVSYLIGISRWINSLGVDSLLCPYDFQVSYEVNFINGCIPDTDLLLAARQPMALLTGLSLAITYVLIFRAGGRLAAFVFVLVFLLNPYILETTLRAKGEAALLFFTVVVMFLIERGLTFWNNYCQFPNQTRERSKALRYFVSTSIGIGLAASAKLNGIFLGITVCFLFLISLLIRANQLSEKQKKQYAVRVPFLFFMIGWFTFVVINPYLYSSPLVNVARMFKWRLQETTEQTLFYTEEVVPVGLSRWYHVFQKIFLDFGSYQSKIVAFVSVAVFLGGIYLLSQHTFRWIRDSHSNTPIHAVLLITPLPIVIAGIFTPLDWDRYYFFPVVYQLMIGSIFAGIGINKILKALWSRSTTTITS